MTRGFSLNLGIDGMPSATCSIGGNACLGYTPMLPRSSVYSLGRHVALIQESDRFQTTQMAEASSHMQFGRHWHLILLGMPGIGWWSSLDCIRVATITLT